MLACVAAERGFRAIVGSRIHMHRAVARLPRGIYLAKDVRRPSLRVFRILRRLGHAIVACDEEGLIFITPALFHRRRVHADALAMAELHLAWGAKGGELVRTAPGYAGVPILETGNPRTDLLRAELRGFYAPDIAALRARHGDFIMVNSNFGRINHFNPELSLSPHAASAAERGTLEPDELPMEAWRFRADVMAAMLAMLPALARAFPERRVVVRPHPAENHGKWRAAAQGLSNIEVVHQGTIAPWLMAAGCIVHNGCTTGVEGRLVGAPVVAYRPVTSPDYEVALPNEVGVTATDRDGLVATVRALADGPRPLPLSTAERATLGPYFAALDGPLAADRMVDALADFAGRRPLAAPTAIDYLRGAGDATLRAFGKRLNALRPGHKDSAAFTRQRFPGVDPAQARERIARFGLLLGRFDGLSTRRITDNVFEIERAD